MIDFINVSKSFGARDILKNASFKINAGERLGIVGPNGAGKTTIFSLICNEQSVDGGKISLPKNQRIAYLRQHLPQPEQGRKLLDFCADAIDEINHINEELKTIEDSLANSGTHREKLLEIQGHLQHKLESLDAYKLHTRAAETLCALGFAADSLEHELSRFSGGWQMRANLARVLLGDPDVLLLDEPSNYLDIPAIEWLCRFLRSFKGTMLLISHDRYLLRRLCNSILEINNARAVRYSGSFDFYVKERESRLIQAVSKQKNQDKKREQLERSIARFRSKNTKAAQVQNWIKQLDRMEEVAGVDSLHYDGVIQLPAAPSSGAETVSLENIDFSYDRDAEKVLNNVSITINRGEKIAFVGYNGAGKTTLLKLLGGFLTPDTGKRTLGHKVISGYQAQEFAEIIPDDMSAYDVVRECLPAGASGNSLRKVLGAFGFSGENADKKCKVLSGGEKIRLCFARIFVNPPNFLMLDEPTTHLDLAAREALQQALRQYKGSLCVVSHDIEFVRNVAETIIAVGGHGATRYYGDYDYYCEKTASENNSQSEENIAGGNAEGGRRKARRRERAEKLKDIQKDISKQSKQVSAIEKKLEALEAERDELTEKLACGNHGGDFAALNRRLSELVVDLDIYNARWEEKALVLEELELQKELVIQK